jgi:hypothetical protein
VRIQSGVSPLPPDARTVVNQLGTPASATFTSQQSKNVNAPTYLEGWRLQYA